jgi:hypothetical protein
MYLPEDSNSLSAIDMDALKIEATLGGNYESYSAEIGSRKFKNIEAMLQWKRVNHHRIVHIYMHSYFYKVFPQHTYIYYLHLMTDTSNIN